MINEVIDEFQMVFTKLVIFNGFSVSRIIYMNTVENLCKEEQSVD